MGVENSERFSIDKGFSFKKTLKKIIPTGKTERNEQAEKKKTFQVNDPVRMVWPNGRVAQGIVYATYQGGGLLIRQPIDRDRYFNLHYGVFPNDLCCQGVKLTVIPQEEVSFDVARYKI